MFSEESAFLDWLLEVSPLAEIFEEGLHGLESLHPSPVEPDSHELLPEHQVIIRSLAELNDCRRHLEVPPNDSYFEP